MVGAKDIDEVVKAAVELVLVVGDIGSKIGVAAVRFHQRTIDVVAIGGGAKQRLLAVLVIIHRRTPLWRRQTALIHIAFGTKIIDGCGDPVVSGFEQRPLGKKHVVLDMEGREIALY